MPVLPGGIGKTGQDNVLAADGSQLLQQQVNVSPVVLRAVLHTCQEAGLGDVGQRNSQGALTHAGNVLNGENSFVCL